MRLDELLKGLHPGPLPLAMAGVNITTICTDSRKVMPGSVFVARPGVTGHGEAYIHDALRRGAVAIIREAEDVQCHEEKGVLHLAVPPDVGVLSRLAERFYGRPSLHMPTIGVTGTNGKTTVTYVFEALCRQVNKPCGVIGTINHRFNGSVIPSGNTTPGLIDLQELMSEMAARHTQICIMEVSSHALDQGRVALVQFAAGVFMNLTSDHLDYHRDREDYFQAKARLFTGLDAGALALLNADDPYADRLRRMTAARVVTFGCDAGADWQATDLQLELYRSRFRVQSPAGVLSIETSLVGRHNVSNILAALALGHWAGIPCADMERGIARLKGVPGRLQSIQRGQAFQVFLDYAHTEDALINVLQSLRQVAPGRILVVFGCGGDRDRSKRSAMGRVVSAEADFSFVTSDNPRTEDPQKIIAEILPGMHNDRYLVEPDRGRAIHQALAMARPDDIVLIAGKGHENYQIIGRDVVPFDEYAIVSGMLDELVRQDSGGASRHV